METFLAKDGAYVVLAFAAVSIPAAAAVVAYFWYKVRRDETVASLKRELSDRGMTAEEICAVIEATPHGSTDVAQDLAAFNGAGSSLAQGTRQ
ncbi:MAG: hypothetical protein ACJ8F7_05700 [Gemmataceae bacterium]